MLNAQNYEPFLVQSPITGQFADLRPFFELVQSDGDTLEESLQYSFEEVDEIIHTISTGFDVDLSDTNTLKMRNMYSRLFNLRNMFRDITVIKKQ